MSAPFRIHAWVARPYNMLVDVDSNATVRQLKSRIEEEFCKEFGFARLIVFVLQDPNHNDLPLDVKVSLVLRNEDKVFVHLHPDSFAPTPSSSSSSSHTASADSSERKVDRNFDQCFRDYFNLREHLIRPNSLRHLTQHLNLTGVQLPDKPTLETEIVLTRIQQVLNSDTPAVRKRKLREDVRDPEKKRKPSTDIDADDPEATVTLIQALPAQSKELLPSVGTFFTYLFFLSFFHFGSPTSCVCVSFVCCQGSCSCTYTRLTTPTPFAYLSYLPIHSTCFGRRALLNWYFPSTVLHFDVSNVSPSTYSPGHFAQRCPSTP